MLQCAVVTNQWDTATVFASLCRFALKVIRLWAPYQSRAQSIDNTRDRNRVRTKRARNDAKAWRKHNCKLHSREEYSREVLLVLIGLLYRLKALLCDLETKGLYFTGWIKKSSVHQTAVCSLCVCLTLSRESQRWQQQVKWYWSSNCLRRSSVTDNESM